MLQDLAGIIIVIAAGCVFLSAAGRARLSRRDGAKQGRMPGAFWSLAAHPASREARAGALADAHRLWEAAKSTDWLEGRRHNRATALKDVTAVTGDDRASAGILPRSAAAATPAPAGKRRTLASALRPLAPRRAAASGNGDQLDGPGAGRPASAGTVPAPPASPPRSPETSPPAITSSGGTTTVAGTAEELIEAVDRMYAKAASGGLRDKHEIIKALIEGLHREAAVIRRLEQLMSEEGRYDHKITEPLAGCVTHISAAANQATESDNALGSMRKATVDALTDGTWRAPEARELNGTGS